jgi:hypothetical protein
MNAARGALRPCSSNGMCQDGVRVLPDRGRCVAVVCRLRCIRFFKETCCLRQRASNQQQRVFSFPTFSLTICRCRVQPIRTAAPPGGLTAEHSRLSTHPRATRARLFLLTEGCLARRMSAVESHSFRWQRARCIRSFLERAHADVNGADRSVELASDCRCFNARREKFAKLLVFNRRPRTTC